MDAHAKDFYKREYDIDLAAARRRLRAYRSRFAEMELNIAVELDEINALKHRAYLMGIDPL